jgi:hypothetical protein
MQKQMNTYCEKKKRNKNTGWCRRALFFYSPQGKKKEINPTA